jgi:ABC-2 type transport system permease protein
MSMSLSSLVAHEWRTRLSRPAALLSLALFAAALLHGAVNGRLHSASRRQAIAAHSAEVATQMAGWLDDLRALQEGRATGVPPWAGSAMDVTFASYLPPAPLEDFAIGQSDLLPHVGAVSLWNPDIRLFSRYELADPVSLALGGFDLGKAILLVLPLLLVVLCFDVLSAERDANRLGLILAQGARVRALVWARLLIRAGAALAVTFLVSLAALLAPGHAVSLSERMPPFALWALAVLVYAAFWVAIIGLVVARNRRGEVNVMLLLVAWAGFNLILPAGAAAVAEAVAPAPSRLTYLAQAREIEIRTERAEADVAHGFLLDHPDLVIDEASEIPAYVRTAFFVTSAVDDTTRPVLAAFDRAAARRDETLGLLRHVSPAIVMHGLFNEIAGTSSARHRRYVAAARALKAAYAGRAGPTIVAGQRLSPALVASLPTFHLEEEGVDAVLRRHAGALLFVTLAAAALLVLADRRLRRAVGPG